MACNDKLVEAIFAYRLVLREASPNSSISGETADCPEWTQIDFVSFTRLKTLEGKTDALKPVGLPLDLTKSDKQLLGPGAAADDKRIDEATELRHLCHAKTNRYFGNVRRSRQCVSHARSSRSFAQTGDQLFLVGHGVVATERVLPSAPVASGRPKAGATTNANSTTTVTIIKVLFTVVSLSEVLL